ncbi:MAG: FAD-binding oxidoreductase [Rhodobacteraceae bacterium]|nr:FAD-binding oxidoreductase [Paracoccaceae bacterium]
MVDITVHGAGIFGLSVAWSCVRRGASVRVIDPGGVGAGASGGLVGALAPHVPEHWNAKKQFQFESLIMAQAMWAQVAHHAGVDPGYARLGRVQPVLEQATLPRARTRATGAQTHWHQPFVWEVIPADSYAGYAPSPTGYLIRDTLSARLHPRKATAALARALTSLGVEIVADGPARGVQVWATGAAGLNEVSATLGANVGTSVKGQAAVLDYDARDMPQLFVDGLHIIPHADGTTAIGSTLERVFDAPSATDAQLDALIAKARELCPALARARVLDRWAGLRPRARSRAPMLGHHPTKSGAFIANGGFMIGFGIAPKAGEVMATLILEGTNNIPADFRPEASLPQAAPLRSLTPPIP